MIEFKIVSPQNFVKIIEFNYDELKNWIAEQVEQYKGLAYTDETIKNAKEDRAKLNKFKESIDNARKDVKRRYLEPYNQFEDKVKTLLALIEEPTKAIDQQVKAYEEQKKAEKRAEIEQFYNAVIGDLASLLPLEKIFNNKWLNSTTTIKAIQAEIEQIISKAKFDIATIKDLKSEWELTLLDTYLNTLDIGAALREKTRLEERKAELEKQNQPIKEAENADNKATDHIVDVNNMVETKIYTRKFWVKGSADQLRALGQYMKEHGIEYGGIE